MNNFKPGDQVDWVTDFCDNSQFKWPGTVISTYPSTHGTVVQFYVRKKGDAEGRMRVKEWLMCHLKPHQPKPRWRMVRLDSLRCGDQFVNPYCYMRRIIVSINHIANGRVSANVRSLANFPGRIDWAADTMVWAEVRHG